MLSKEVAAPLDCSAEASAAIGACLQLSLELHRLVELRDDRGGRRLELRRQALVRLHLVAAEEEFLYKENTKK